MNNPSPEQLANWRQEFELAMLFSPLELPSYPGNLVRNELGHYADHFIEAAWRGYMIKSAEELEQLQNFDAMRYISPSLVSQFRHHSEYDETETDVDQIHSLIRTVLDICRENPV